MAEKTAEEVTAAITEEAGGETTFTDIEKVPEKPATTEEAAKEVSEPEKKVGEAEVVGEEAPKTEEQELIDGKFKTTDDLLAAYKASETAMHDAKAETAGWKQAFGTMAGIEKQTGAPALSKEQIAEKFNTGFYANPHEAIQELISQQIQGGLGPQVDQVQRFQNAQAVTVEVANQLGDKAQDFASDIAEAFKENPGLWQEKTPTKAVEKAITIVKGMRYDAALAKAQTQGKTEGAEAVTAKQNAGTLRPGTGATQAGSPNYTEADVARTAQIIQTGLPTLSDADARKEAISALRGK